MLQEKPVSWKGEMLHLHVFTTEKKKRTELDTIPTLRNSNLCKGAQ